MEWTTKFNEFHLYIFPQIVFSYTLPKMKILLCLWQKYDKKYYNLVIFEGKSPLKLPKFAKIVYKRTRFCA